jgi:hypothetical protein
VTTRSAERLNTEFPVKQAVDMAAPHWWHIFHVSQHQAHVAVDNVELRPQFNRQVAAPERESLRMFIPIVAVRSLRAP